MAAAPPPGALDAGRVGTFEVDLRTGRLHADDRLLALFGFERGAFDGTLATLATRLHPEDLPRATRALHDAARDGGELALEHRVVVPGQGDRWLAARGQAAPGPDGSIRRIVGAAYDITHARDGESRVARVLDSMSDAFYALDRDWRFTYVNAEAERLLGHRRADVLGRVVWELFPSLAGSDLERCLREAAGSGESVTLDAHAPEPLQGWYEVRAWPGPDGLSVHLVDISARRAAQEQAERDAERSALLAQVTAELTGTLDTSLAVARLAQLVVPTLGDWCIVTTVEDEGPGPWHHLLRDVGWWHVDEAMRPVVERYAAVRLRTMSDSSFLVRSLRSGRMLHVAQDATRAISTMLRSAEAQALLEQLAPESVCVLPLRGRARTVGLLSVFAGPARAPLGAEDLAAARDIAGRAGLALDNARLFDQQSRLAEGLQRSLMTDPAATPDLDVVVRYLPAAESAKVGGDWYDAFVARDGATVLSIGDVVGHDTAAAAAMGQLRGLLRGIAAHTGEGPAEVLRGVDRVIDTLQMATTATAVLARVLPASEPRSPSRRLQWSNAGHPPPMLVGADGTVTVLAHAEADLLLGIDPHGTRSESEVVLERGSTLLLYTDGLVERRGESLDEGLLALGDALRDLATRGLSLDELCDSVLQLLLPPRREDDVALVAVRLADTQPSSGR